MDTIDAFYNGIEKDVKDANTKTRLSLNKRRGRQFIKDISKNKFASKDMIKKAISKNKKIEVLIKKRMKKIK